MREAARNVVTRPPHLQPRRPADQGRRQVRHGRVRDARQQGPPAVPLLVRRLHARRTRDRAAQLRARRDSELVVLAFAYDSRTKGNAATEIVKYFMQLHYGIKKDYRNFDLLERGNFYHEQLTTANGRHPSRASTRHRLGCQARSARPGARSTCSWPTYAALLGGDRPRRWPTRTASRTASSPLDGGTTFARGLMWAGHRADRVHRSRPRSTTAGSRPSPGRSTRSSSGCWC